MKNTNANKIVVIIPCYNEEKVISRKIENCLEIDLKNWGDLEIIIVDDFSNDRTSEIVKQYVIHDSRVSFYRNEKEKGKSGAVATGINHTNAQFVCITDADVLFEKGALSETVKLFADKKVGLVSGIRRYVSMKEGTITERFDFYTWVRIQMILFFSMFGKNPSAMGPMMTIRKETNCLSRKVGADDFDLPVEIIKKGYKSVVSKKSFFLETYIDDKKERSRQMLRRAGGMFQTIWLHRDLFLNPQHGALGLFIYPLEFIFCILQPVLVLVTLTCGIVLLFLNYKLGFLLIGLIAVLLIAPGFRQFIQMNVIMLKAIIATFTHRDGKLTDNWEPPER